MKLSVWDPTKWCTVLLCLLLLPKEVVYSADSQSACSIAPSGYPQGVPETYSAPEKHLREAFLARLKDWLQKGLQSLHGYTESTLARLVMTYARTSLGGSLPALNDLAPKAGLCRQICGCTCRRLHLQSIFPHKFARCAVNEPQAAKCTEW